MFCDPALAAVDPLGERLFLAVPARAGVVRGSRRAVCHAGSAFTVRLRARNSPSTALYTRVPVKNRVRISRALRRIRAQRPRPHMGGRALGTLARPRLATDWLRQPSARCRFDAIPITHLHTATVEAHTDNLGARAALKGRTARCAANTPAAVSAPTCADTSGPRPTTPSRAQAHQSIIKQYIDGQTRPL